MPNFPLCVCVRIHNYHGAGESISYYKHNYIITIIAIKTRQEETQARGARSCEGFAVMQLLMKQLAPLV